jgi:hypothetical protein
MHRNIFVLLVLILGLSNIFQQSLASGLSDHSGNTAWLHSAPALEAKINVDVNDDVVVSHVTFRNVSNEIVWIKKGIYGISRDFPNKIFNGFADEFYVKLINGRVLGFNGFIVDFAGSFTKEENFTPLVPGEIAVISKVLGPIPDGKLKGKYIYHFLPGTHGYEISARYMIFDEKDNTIKTFFTEPTTFTLTLPEKKP